MVAGFGRVEGWECGVHAIFSEAVLERYCFFGNRSMPKGFWENGTEESVLLLRDP